MYIMTKETKELMYLAIFNAVFSHIEGYQIAMAEVEMAKTGIPGSQVRDAAATRTIQELGMCKQDRFMQPPFPWPKHESLRALFAKACQDLRIGHGTDYREAHIHFFGE